MDNMKITKCLGIVAVLLSIVAVSVGVASYYENYEEENLGDELVSTGSIHFEGKEDTKIDYIETDLMNETRSIGLKLVNDSNTTKVLKSVTFNKMHYDDYYDFIIIPENMEVRDEVSVLLYVDGQVYNDSISDNELLSVAPDTEIEVVLEITGTNEESVNVLLGDIDLVFAD